MKILTDIVLYLTGTEKCISNPGIVYSMKKFNYPVYCRQQTWKE
jgi:hypothetical protein